MAESPKGAAPARDDKSLDQDLLTTVRHNDIYVYDLVLLQAQKTPLAEAISTTEESLTYQELTRRTCIMYKTLKDAGIQPGDRVMLMSDKNASAIASFLAMLKLKTLCVIVNPAFPDERLGYIMNHTQCKAIVTDVTFEKKARRLGLPIVMIPGIWPNGSAPDAVIESSTVIQTARDGAVITFTSGSTGKPKAVLYSHAAMSNMAVALGRDFGYGTHSRVFQFAAFGWVIALQDIFITLVNGGTLCVPTTYQIENELVQTMWTLRANYLSITSSLVSTLEDEDLELIRTLIFVGEAANPETVVRLDKNGRHVIVNYGCSEANTILGTAVLVKGRELFFLGTNTTNKPWLVDPDDHNVLLDTPGAIGELISETCTAPTGLLTEEGVGGDCFIGPPSWRANYPALNWQHTTFVKTGDLFQRTEDGHFKCIGRKDFQIKIRGQRLDPSEVEYHVKNHVPGILEVACVKGQFKDSRSDLLVCFVVFDDQAGQAEQHDWVLGLDQILLQYLPSFMLPAGFVVIPKFPRTATGKVDRRTIVNTMSTMSVSDMVSYTIDDPSSACQISEPTLSSAELGLRRLWSKVLRLDEESIKQDSNFFRLGGDSIDSMKLVRLARREGLDLSVSLVISYPRLAELASTVSHPEPEVKQINTNQEYSPFCLLREKMIDAIILEATQQCQIFSSNIADMYPCTPTQAGLMALTAQQPGSYWVAHKFALPSGWQLSQAEKAGEQVIMENELLRSRIIQLDTGECIQVILKESVRSDSLECHEDSPFGKSLFLCSFEKDASNDTVYMSWRVHHAIYDGWSARLILQAFVSAYQQSQDYSANSPPFSRFLQFIGGIDWSESASFWLQELQGYEGQSFPRLPGSSIARPTRQISKISSWRGTASGITASSMVRAAWAIVLSKYSKSSDVAFGVIVTGRTLPVPDIENIMGPTICAVPVRVQIRDLQSVSQLLKDIQDQYARMIPHEQFGLPRIQELGDSGPAQASKFQSLVIVQPSDLSVAVHDGTEIKEVDIGVDDYLTYPVTLECLLNKDTITHNLTIDESSITHFEAECLLGQFVHVFELLQDLSSAELEVSQIDIRPPSEAEIISQWNENMTLQAFDECLHEMILSRSTGWLDTVAVASWDGEISYRELLFISTALAAKLVSAGVQPEAIIPIMHHKSLWTLVSILAVLQAGGAFLLVEKSLPFSRVQTMFETTSAKFLICSPDLMKMFSSLASQTICLDDPMKQELRSTAKTSSSGCSSTLCRSCQPVFSPHSLGRSQPHNSAYAVMTSGTTGTPKCTILEHRQASSSFFAQVQKGLFRPGWRMLQFASYSFDPCIADMIGPLLVGGTVCIPREEDRLTELATIINDLKVDIVELTPSVASMLNPSDVPNLKVLRFGGEEVTATHVNHWASHDHVFLENSYGPSECCITCSLTPRVTQKSDPANFGSAFGCHMWIVDLDDRTRLAPLGLIGELAIQGPIVGRGYINNQVANNDAFLPCPPWLEYQNPSPLTRVYMTGDLVRYAPDGSLTFVGRRDNQIKLRGQRIELEEIENVAMRLDSITEAIAFLVKAPDATDHNLALVLSMGSGAQSQVQNSPWNLRKTDDMAAHLEALQNLDRLLRGQLPPYMVPKLWFIIDQFPMSQSGKIDPKIVQKSIEDMTPDALEGFNAIRMLNIQCTLKRKIPAADKTAIQLRSIFNVMLKRENSATDEDDYSDIVLAAAGLDSIKSVSFVRSINQHFGIRMSMVDFLNRETLTQVARAVDRLRSRDSESTPIEEVQVDYMIRDLESLVSQISRRPENIGNVFLTGATGYVGTALLHTLVSSTSVKTVYVLVRADSAKAGLQRVIQAATIAGWWKESYHEHIRVWPGDLEKPQLGLSNEQWELLNGSDASSPQNINTIVHNGAVVNWFLSYTALRLANVSSTAQLLRAAVHSESLTRFLFVSGGSQWNPEGNDGCLSADRLVRDLRNTNGYGQSKLIAEQLVAQTADIVQEGGTMFATLKPGLIIGGQKSNGIANTDDFVWRVVKACMTLGSYCDEGDGDGWIYLSRQEDIGSAMMEGLCSVDLHWEKKMVCGLRVKRFWAAVNAALAQPLQSCSHKDWIASLRSQVNQQGPKHPCWPVMHFLEQGPDLLGSPMPPKYLLGEDVDQSGSELEDAVTCNVKYLQRVGFFGESERTSESANCFARSKFTSRSFC